MCPLFLLITNRSRHMGAPLWAWFLPVKGFSLSHYRQVLAHWGSRDFWCSFLILWGLYIIKHLKATVVGIWCYLNWIKIPSLALVFSLSLPLSFVESSLLKLPGVFPVIPHLWFCVVFGTSIPFWNSSVNAHVLCTSICGILHSGLQATTTLMINVQQWGMEILTLIAL